MTYVNQYFKRVLKRSESGFEMEFNLIDSKGSISSDSGSLIRKSLKAHPSLDIDSESTQNMVEIRSVPAVKLGKCFLNILNSIENVAYTAPKLDVQLLPLATYPGKFQESATEKKRYELQQKMFDPKLHKYVCSRAAAFHYHYALPYGVFDSTHRSLKKLIKSKAKRTLINSYNFAIAADPALIVLLQSSPFVDGKFFAKDSRVVLYRAGKRLRCDMKLFKKQNLFKGLPPYIFTMEDLNHKLRRMNRYWVKKLTKLGLKREAKKKDLLDFVWNPIKINKSGTLEQRSMDINYLKYCFGSAVLMKSAFKLIQREFYEVVPSEIAIEKPFKVEGETIYIPPLTRVRNKLQRKAAYEGYESKMIRNYARRFYNFASKHVEPEYKHVLKPIKRMIDGEKSVSDNLIAQAKKAGYSLDDKLPVAFTRELSLKTSEKFMKDLEKVREMVEKL